MKIEHGVFGVIKLGIPGIVEDDMVSTRIGYGYIGLHEMGC